MRPALLFFVLVLLGGCAAMGPEIHSQRRSETDFAAYRSFAFFSPLGTDKAEYASLVSQQLKAETRRVLEARDYRYAPDAPDMLINFTFGVRKHSGYHSFPGSVFYGGFGGRRRGGVGFGYQFPLGGGTYPYQESILGIDIIDARTKDVLWEGEAINRMRDFNKEDLAPILKIAVEKILGQYPVPEAAGKDGAKTPEDSGSANASAESP
ncbi:MAG: DUF4136 domain-containing protein [Zoogloeaceae bacterium]|jgi:hypothetical protein|nr:DUF4136 domain-containing protein [Zoogloeaceae bacterium]